MESFALLRTHTGLSSNIKIVVDSKYNLYVETIDSVDELSANRFKKIQFNKTNYYDELVPFLFKNLPTDIAFSIKYDNDNFDMSTDFAKQYDDIYLAGARNIIENKNYNEEYEYFAPLYVFKHHMPKYFIIFRIDGPGLLKMTKDNFRSEFLEKFKTVKIFDLTRNTELGEWIDNNFKSNKSFPVAPLEVDFRKLEFTRWIGIDYESGGYTSKPSYLEENLENENTLFDFEKFFLDGYKINNIVFPHIINFNFLFDDEPATPQTLRKWSLNRYSGFYIDDMEVIDTVTPYVMPELRGDVVIESGNIIKSLQFGDPFKNGFREDIDMWIEYLGEFYKVIKFEEISEKSVVRTKDTNKKKRLTVEEVSEPMITKYKIVSELDIEGQQSLLNNRSCYINNNNEIVLVSTGTPYLISDFDYADVNLIEINGIFHNLIKDGLTIKLNTDYGFKFSKNNSFTYFTNSEKEGYTFSWDLLISKNNSPKNWKIYRLKFTDVKDFDTNIIDTEFARFEYEKRDDITRTEEPKMYLTDLRSKSLPQDFDDFTFKGKTELIPVASDYTANLETFRVEGNKLTDLWRKNPIYCRWGYQNSLSAYDYPYLLNNNDVEGVFNLTCDTQNLTPDRKSRNLDYFYTINSGTTSYLYHSLHIEKNYGNVQDTSFRFELDKYLELGSYSQLGTTYSYEFDYFDIFFSQTASFLDGELIQNRKKYSYFEAGDSVIPNTTVFRGLKFRLFEVDNIKSNKLNIENINLFSSNLFQDYKFSILLSSNDWMISEDNQLYKPYTWDYFIDEQKEGINLSLLSGYGQSPSGVNIGDLIEIDQFYPYDNAIYQQENQLVTNVGTLTLGGYGITLQELWQGNNDITPGIWRNKMQWQVIKEWEWDTSYNSGDLVLYENQVFQVLNGATVSDPNQDPISLTTTQYIPLSSYPQLWNYLSTYSIGDWVYHFGEYYEQVSVGATDFWNPVLPYTASTPPDTVIYNNRYYECIVNTLPGIRPVVQNKKIQSSSGVKYWKEIPKPTNVKWEPIKIWNRNQNSYTTNSLVVWNDILYKSTQLTTIDDIPGESSVWRREYSFVPDTEYIYGPNDNSIIKINDSYYYCKYNPGLTLDNGITIYINKKWKNVLVNISINDNTIQSNHPTTMDETKNIERDFLYVLTNGRLTAANFLRQINDLDTLYGFADFTSYVVIEEDGTFKKYNFNNISELPYFMVCEETDEFDLRDDTLRYSANTIDKNTLKSNRFLVDGNIDNLEKIDFYNEVPLGANIENVKGEPGISVNYNSQSNNISSKLHRHSGYYMPIFYEVELFNNAGIYDSGSLCDIQFIIWLGTASGGLTQSITLNLSDSNNSVEIETILEIPEDDSQSSIEDFYEPIIDVINNSEIFSGDDLVFEILEPGNENIHPNMADGFWVLSIKHDRPICDIRVSASSGTECVLILNYFFQENNWSTEQVINELDNGGLIISQEEINLCCPNCGPQILGFLQYPITGTQPFKLLYEELVSPICPVMATASTMAWNQFLTWYFGPIQNDSEFDLIYNNLSPYEKEASDAFGIGQYGSPGLLSSFITLISGLDDPQLAFVQILSRGLYINCEGGNYVLRTPSEPIVQEISSICVKYTYKTGSYTSNPGYSTFSITQDGHYTGDFNGFVFYIIFNNTSRWEIRRDSPTGSLISQQSIENGQVDDQYYPVSESGNIELFDVELESCSIDNPPIYEQNLCLKIISNLGNGESKNISMIWSVSDDAYVGYEQPIFIGDPPNTSTNGLIVRKFIIKLINGNWELYYIDANLPSPIFDPNNEIGPISRYNQSTVIPLTTQWISTFGFFQGGPTHRFDGNFRVYINTSIC